jgi:O-acetylhomoserine (thiol)-lyase
LRDIGAALSPINALLILKGVETVALRIREHNKNALAVAQFVQKHPKVDQVIYPRL